MAQVYPAVRGNQRGTQFFLGHMAYAEIAKIRLPDERGKVVDDLFQGEDAMQRDLNWSRVRGDMKRYLLEVGNPFFSALTLVILPPGLQPAEEGKHFKFKPAEPEADFGELEISGSCELFPVDGQHRAAAIREALKEDPNLSEVHVPIVFLAYQTREQVRQFFSDLNLHAKIPSKTLGYAFESRDPIAIIAKRLSEFVPLFEGRVNMRTNSLPRTSTAVITLNSLYVGTGLLFKAFCEVDGCDEEEAKGDLLQLPPTHPRIDEEAQRHAEVWNTIIASLPDLDAVQSGALSPGELRDKYIYGHGLGWQALTHAASVIVRMDPENWKERLTATIQSINWSRYNSEFEGLGVTGTRVNNTNPGIISTAGYILEKAEVSADYEPAKQYLTALDRAREARRLAEEQRKAEMIESDRSLEPKIREQRRGLMRDVRD